MALINVTPIMTSNNTPSPYNATVSHTEAFHAQTLPMSTTEKILAKTGDSRTGFMGIANDGDNFGTAYVVDPTGKSKMMMCGIRTEVIFDGNSASGQLSTVAKSIKHFKKIDIVFTVSGTGGATLSCPFSINVDDIVFGTNKHYGVAYQNTTTYSMTTQINFPSENSFIHQFSATSFYTNPRITKIVGIY